MRAKRSGHHSLLDLAILVISTKFKSPDGIFFIPLLLPLYVQIFCLFTSKYSASLCPNILPLYVQIFCLFMYKYYASLCPNGLPFLSKYSYQRFISDSTPRNSFKDYR
jgi:hypothetical protein